MSVVLVTPDDYQAIRKTVQHLRAQNVKNELELIIVAPRRATLDLDPKELADFFDYRVVEVGTIESGGHAVAAGIRQARASVVVYVEEHSYPAPDWAEALIRAHRQPWAAVGPVMLNANPGSMISWAALFFDFSAFVAPAHAGVVGALPSHQTSYKRALLLDYGLMLEHMLEAEVFLQQDLQAKGYQLYLEPAARTAHLNVSRFGSFLRQEYYGYRQFAANRARHECWSPLRRWLVHRSRPAHTVRASMPPRATNGSVRPTKAFAAGDFAVTRRGSDRGNLGRDDGLCFWLEG